MANKICSNSPMAVATDCSRVVMRGSRKFCQRGSSFDNVFLGFFF